MQEVAPVLKKAISPRFFLLALTVLGSCSAASATDVPEWLRYLSKQPAKTYADDVNAVILLDDQVTTVKENGEIVRHGRFAARILRPEGREFAAYPVFYDSDSKVSYLRGWSITGKGQEYEAKDVMEQTVSSYEVYSDLKVKAVRVPGADVGTVVGFEFEQKERPYIFQDHWDFQTTVPVESSRYELHLAPGWRFKADWVNHEEQKPKEEGGVLVWQLGNLPRIEREPHRPPNEALSGHMVLTFLSDKNPSKSYRDWSEFGSWYTQLSSGVRDASAPLQQKVQELAPASMPLLERIKVLAGFAQRDVRYVEIKIGVGGYRPHTAADIYNHRYGDCKDKATVLSSMLAQIGIKSYYMLVRTDRGIFTEKSPPMARFDHMILAISLPEASYPKAMPAMYQHPKLGRLLIFDPTNEFVPFGQIPSYEQDNYGLLVGEQGGDLIHLPLSKAEANGVTRNAKLTLTTDGAIHGEIEEIRSGFEAMRGRASLMHETEGDRKKLVERMLGRTVSNFQINGLEVVNADEIDKDLILRYKFSADHYAKSAGQLLLVRPHVVGELAGAWEVNKPRHYAYQFDAPFLDNDSVEITLPEGFMVDELPEPAKSSFPFGQYVSKTENSGNILKYTRQYKMDSTLVSMEQMDQLKKLFGQINSDEKNMAVLKKAN
ncbi:MAG: hypothetical protein JWM83_2246 [Candidatus Angelobacter sp.]|nr:hypothetical protein [Candidatus Angelobacter sp.]